MDLFPACTDAFSQSENQKPVFKKFFGAVQASQQKISVKQQIRGALLAWIVTAIHFAIPQKTAGLFPVFPVGFSGYVGHRRRILDRVPKNLLRVGKNRKIEILK